MPFNLSTALEMTTRLDCESLSVRFASTRLPEPTYELLPVEPAQIQIQIPILIQQSMFWFFEHACEHLPANLISTHIVYSLRVYY